MKKQIITLAAGFLLAPSLLQVLPFGKDLGWAVCFSQNLAVNTTGAANSTSGSLLQIDNSPASNILSGSSITMSNVPFSLNVPLSTNGYGSGLRFLVTGVPPSNGGGAIVFERTGGYSQGKLHFATKSTITDDATIPVRMTIDQNGNVGINSTAPNTTFDVNGSVAFREGTALALVNGANNDIVILSSAFFRITGPTAAFSISGLQSGYDGKIVTLYNTTIQAMTIVNNATSVPANQILTLTGANIVTPAGPNVVQLQYNATAARWILIGGQNYTSGGGTTLSCATDNYLTKRSGANNLACSIAYDDGSAIGIGTITPVQQLDITGSFNLPVATGATVGMIRSGNTRFLYTCATNQTFMGLYSGNVTLASMTGNNNTGCGYASLNALTSGNRNTAVGLDALRLNTAASDNTAIGQAAMRSNTFAERNVAVGNDALFTQAFTNTSTVYQSDNVAVGYRALYTNNPASTGNGIQNTAVGNFALYSNTTGFDNTANGYQALYSNTTGTYNTGIGTLALYSNLTGANNIAAGHYSLRYNTASENVALGYEALNFTQTGSNNTAVGNHAGFGVTLNSFSNNSLFGYKAGEFLTTGSNNILLGYQVGDALTSGANNILLGYDIDAPVATGSNQLSIGNLIYGTGGFGTGTTVGAGSIGIRTNTPLARLHVYDAGRGNIELLTTGINPGHDFGYDGGGDDKFYFAHIGLLTGTTQFRWSPAGNDNILMEILNTGLVGIGTGTVAPTSLLHVNGAGRFGLASTTNGSLIFNNATNAFAVTLQTGVTSASYALTLPLAQGGASTFLQNDGAGNLSWAAGGGGTTLSCATDNYLTKRSGAGNLACSQVYDNGTNVGIGTTTMDLPALGWKTLSVARGAVSQGSILEFQGNQTADGTVGALSFVNDAIAAGEKRIAYINGRRVGADNSGHILFWTNDAGTFGEKMRISSDGHVAIGTTTTGTLDAAQFLSANRYLTVSGTATNGAVVNINKPVAPADLEQAGWLAFAFDGQTAGQRYVSMIGSYSDGPTLNLRGGLLALATKPDNAATAPLNRMYIHQNGDINIYSVDANGAFHAANNGTLSPGLVFGWARTEGISSKRTATGNQYGLDFYTASTNRMAITSGGNVGVGTTVPSEKLHVVQSQDAKSRIYLQNATSGTSAAAELLIRRSNNQLVSIGIGDPTYNAGSYPADFRGGYIYTNTTEGIAFRSDDASGPFRWVLNGTGIPTEYMRITPGGNVGIGTTAPSSLLHVNGTGRFGLASTTNGSLIFNNATNAFAITLQTGVTSASYALTLPTAQGGASTFLQNDGAGNLSWAAGGGGTTLSCATDNYLTKRSGANNLACSVMYDDGIRVGIGTATPGAPLDVQGAESVAGPGTKQIGAWDNTAMAANVGGTIVLGGKYNAAGNYAHYGAVKGGKENATSADYASYMAFYTRPNAVALTERMRITSAGNVGIGCNAPAYTLDVRGTLGVSGQITTSVAVVTTGVAACSDIRYKKNINPLQNSLSNVLKLQGVNYLWKKDEFPEKSFTDEIQIGFIAQEIEKIYPQVVMTDKDGYKSVDYSRLTPILVEAMKEQQKIIDSQQSTIDKLRTTNDQQEARIKKVEEYLFMTGKK